MACHIDLLDPSKLSQTEAAFLDLVRRGRLLAWIHENNENPHDAVEYLRAVCVVLSGMQRKGMISGFEEVYTGGQRLPIVCDIVVVGTGETLF